jgi:hypothetical protein
MSQNLPAVGNPASRGFAGRQQRAAARVPPRRAAAMDDAPGTLAAMPTLLYSVKFAAPVIRDETNGGTMFPTRAELGT